LIVADDFGTAAKTKSFEEIIAWFRQLDGVGVIGSRRLQGAPDGHRDTGRLSTMAIGVWLAQGARSDIVPVNPLASNRHPLALSGNPLALEG